METTGIKISQLDPIPQDWTEEQIANLMNVGLIPISLESMEMTFKATLGLVLSYAIGKSNSAESIAEEYSSDKSYKKSEFCLHERDLYVAKNDMPAGEWNESNWSKIPLSFFVNKIPFMIALKYDRDTTYNKGSYCCNDYTYYKCKENNVTGAFNATKWDEINVAQELSALWQAVGSKTKLSDFTDDITLQLYTPSGTTNANPISSAALANFGTIIISPNYSSAKVYNKGNICFKDGLMYESKENNVTGDWDASKWKQTNLADAITKLMSGMTDSGDKTESDLSNGTLTIAVENSTTRLFLTSISSLTIIANSGVPNFALEVDNTQNTHDVLITVYKSDGVTKLRNSVAGGTTISSGSFVQITAVGNCWTMAEFEVEEEGSGSGS